MSPPPFYTPGDREENAAFKVLNQDNFPMTIIGEPILKPFDKTKPNVIVHPTRRITIGNLEESKTKPLAKSNDYLNVVHNDNEKSIGKSTGDLYYNHIDARMKIDDVNKFTKTLDLKLKRLQKNELTNRQNKKSPPTENVARKPFVTTVKKGQFLEPPSETAVKPEENQYNPKKFKEGKIMYAFASRPRVLSRTPPQSVHQARCDAAARAHAKLVGAVVGIKTDEKNLAGFVSANEDVSEKRVAHQSHQQPKWNPHFAYAKTLSKYEVDAEIGISRTEEAKRRSLARKKARNQQLKSSQKDLNPSQVVQKTEIFSLDQLQKVFANRQLADISTQTEERNYPDQTETSLHELSKSDVETQIYPGDLFDFDKEVQPVIEVLVGRTIEQALIEVLEEEELAALKEQQRRFIEVMSNETAESMKIAKLKRQRKYEEMERQMVTTIVAQQDYIPMLISSV